MGFDLGEESATVVAANSENPGSEITNLIEVRTKLKFMGNQVGLRNPELVPTLVSDIKEQQHQHGDSKFLFCLHVGTTAGESIKTKRAGFMEGRSQSLLDALHENDEELGVGASSAFDDTPFEHFHSTRFAGLVMKVYTGDVAPTHQGRPCPSVCVELGRGVGSLPISGGVFDLRYCCRASIPSVNIDFDVPPWSE